MNHLPLIALIATSSVTAPVPKETEKQQIERKFGKIVDPQGDSKFALDGDKLLVTLPAKETRSFDYEVDPTDPRNWRKYKLSSTAPRVEFSVTGDFTLTARVAATIADEAKPIRKDKTAFIAGGIQLLTSEGDWYYVGPTHINIKTVVIRGHYFENPLAHTKGFELTNFEAKNLSDSSWVRLKRIGNKIEFSISPDGKEFKPFLSGKSTVYDDTLTLGLTSHHSSDKAHTVTFDHFTLEQPDKK